MNEKDHDLIEAYFKNNLSEEEKAVFEDRMKADENFRKEVKSYGAFAQILEASVEEDLRESMRKIDLEKGPTKTSFSKPWIIATILGALLIIVLAIWKQTNDINPQQIAANYAVYEFNDKSRNAYEVVDSVLNETYFVHMREANQLFEEGKYVKARTVLQRIKRTEMIPAQNKEWMITLSYYLENGRTDENFHKMLNKILDEPDHINYSLAVKLDNEVNSFWGRLKE